jgi:hypothetical protein
LKDWGWAVDPILIVMVCGHVVVIHVWIVVRGVRHHVPTLEGIKVVRDRAILVVSCVLVARLKVTWKYPIIDLLAVG